MLDMGFAPQLNQILRHLPRARQTLLFSATLPREIEQLALQMLNDPARVAIGAISKPVEKIQQSTVEATGKSKNEVLLDLVNARPGSIIIFARTKHRTDRVAKFLTQFRLPVARIHGDRTQGQRTRAMEGFRSGEFRILVATDIAARGLDISHIAHVINYDLPQVPEDYVHRIGRTARAGAEGEAVSILTPEDREMWGRIQKLVRGDRHAGGPAQPQPRRTAHSGEPAQKSKKPRRWRRNRR
jgi:superfamily II DNA/RNA helicase